MPESREISETEIIARIDDDEVPDAELEAYFDFEVERLPAALKDEPEVAAGEDVVNLSTAHEGIIGAFNRRANRYRIGRFEKRLPGFEGTTVVAEGDSWFQYPLFLRDTIDHLMGDDSLNIYCQSAAGDWLANIAQQKQYIAAIERYDAEVFLISGGGNDLVGKRRLRWLLRHYTAGQEPGWYLEGGVGRVLEHMRALYVEIFDELTVKFPKLRIISHGYDHVIPANRKWLGKPMKELGIVDENLQANIAKVMINRVNDMGHELAERYEQVEHVDCRGQVSAWFDELHPRDEGYAAVAKLFRERIG